MERPKVIPIVPAAPAAHDEEGDCSGAEPFVLMVLGDSMAPEFAEGEIIVVEPEGLASDGSFVVAELQDGWTLRRLARTEGGWELRALGAGWPAVAIPDLAPVRGVVIQKSSPGRRRAAKRYVE
jgi:SOS-response transcriptional repressor LexA